jgi:TRAP-type mannitol/chloroaromatic compound transport system permease small subunit
MSEQTMTRAESDAAGVAFIETPGDSVRGMSRIIGAVSDVVILTAFICLGSFVGLFVEDSLVHLNALEPMKDQKHGHFGTEFMLTGAGLCALYIIFQNVAGFGREGKTIAGRLMRTRVTNMAGEPAGVIGGLFLRTGIPLVLVAGIGYAGYVVEALALGAVLILCSLFTGGRTLYDLVTGTKVVWADDVDEIPSTVHLSEALRRFVDRFGRFGSWWIVPVVLITCFDVIARKAVWENSDGIRVGIQIFLVENFGRFFDSTLLQEMEWHSHTILFAFVLGYGYIHNTHVRVDLLRERFDFRLKAQLEFFGLTFFLIPYCLIVAYFALEYAVDSYAISEISASQVGLPMRWVPKLLLFTGLLVTVAAGVSVWLQVAVALWGPRNIRFELMTLEWPEEVGSKIEGKERLDLAKVEDELERRARESGHLKERKDGAAGDA